MKPKNLYYHILLIFIGISIQSHSQTFEEFRKRVEKQFSQFKIHQQKELDKLAAEFDAYIYKSDKDFVDYIKKEWKAYSLIKSIEIPNRPKPIEIPKLNSGKTINDLSSKKINALIPKLKTEFWSERPLVPLVQKTEPKNFVSTSFSFDYYGSNLSFSIDKTLTNLTLKTINEQLIGDWWEQCSEANYNNFINQLLDTKNKLNLNDWAYLMLVKKSMEAIVGNDINQTNLLTWFLLMRSGYESKIAYCSNRIYLLIPSSTELYGRSFLSVNNKCFYFMEDSLPSVFYTYDFDFVDATRPINLNIYQPLSIGTDEFERKINFKYKEKQYSFPVILNKNNLSYLSDYPVTELNVYFDATMTESTKLSLADGLMHYMLKMNIEESVNFLLSFVQTAFIYKTDQDQFKKEKFFFPEEVLYYEASDCEDRSALFSYLIKQLLHLEVIGLEFKEHIATAVHLPVEVVGDYIYYHNSKYLIADPTYLNAPLGLSMPYYKNQQPKVIETNHSKHFKSLTQKFWDTTMRWGGNKGSNLNDAKIDSKGNCYLTGYYNQNIDYGNIKWKSKNENRQAFIVKYNADVEIQWARNIHCEGIATGFALTFDSSENPVITGSFRGKIKLNGQEFVTEKDNPDIFIAAYSADGELKWFNKSGLEAMDYHNFMNYVITFDLNGKFQNKRLYVQNESKVSNGVFYNDNKLTVIGFMNSSTGFYSKNLSFNANEEFNTINYLKAENDALIARNVNKSIAGLFAVINLIKISGVIIPGKDAQQALDKHNPKFKLLSPSVYKNIGKVNFMKNNDGIISILTNKRSVIFDKIKINDGATLKITSLPNGTERIDIISGVDVGKFVVWYTLNFVQLKHDSGDLLFDYDSDHTQTSVNLKTDILN